MPSDLEAKPYDSTADTIAHIERVQELLGEFRDQLIVRAECHDDSKLYDPEKSIFDTFTPLLKSMKYGSDEYNQALKDMKVGLEHHYQNNTHHPEYYPDGIDGMTLGDAVEMFHDWVASSERQPSKTVNLTYCKERFKMSDQLLNIFKNECLVRGIKFE